VRAPRPTAPHRRLGRAPRPRLAHPHAAAAARSLTVVDYNKTLSNSGNATAVAQLSHALLAHVPSPGVFLIRWAYGKHVFWTSVTCYTISFVLVFFTASFSCMSSWRVCTRAKTFYQRPSCWTKTFVFLSTIMLVIAFSCFWSITYMGVVHFANDHEGIMTAPFLNIPRGTTVGMFVSNISYICDDGLNQMLAIAQTDDFADRSETVQPCTSCTRRLLANTDSPVGPWRPPHETAHWPALAEQPRRSSTRPASLWPVCSILLGRSSSVTCASSARWTRCACA
jgi:hypothetical protein